MLGPANPSAVEKNAKDNPAANTAAIVTIAAVANEYHVIDSIHAGFDKAPAAAAKLNVTFGGTEKWAVDIPANVTAARPATHTMPRGFYTKTKNEEVIVTLAAGGATVSGKVVVTYR